MSGPDLGKSSTGGSAHASVNGHVPVQRGDALKRLAVLLKGQGGVIATLLDEAEAPAGRGPAPDARLVGPAQLTARGPRAGADPAEYELLIEAIYEGYLLHYATPRLVHAPEADLALLAGDQLYALGLARLVALGDTAAVAELADVITLCALAHGDGCPELAEMVWQAGARAIGWGPSADHQRAKALMRAGSDEALTAMRAAAAAGG